MNNLKAGEGPKKKPYKILVDDVMLEFANAKVSGKEILIKAGKTPPECHTLYQKLKGCDFERISLDEIVDLSNPGIEKFTVKPPEVWYYTIDDEPETTDEQFLTPNKILELGGIKPVSDYYVIEITNDGQEINHKNHPDQKIQMRCPGSKFVSVFRGETPVS